jgi:hypothetical protein
MVQEGFKKSFFAGELIWMVGVESPSHGLTEILKSCWVRASQIRSLEVSEVLAMEEGHVPDVSPDSPEVWCIRLCSGEDSARRESFIQKLRWFFPEKVRAGQRVILVSECRDPGWTQSLQSWNAISGDSDEKVHGLLELAARYARVRVGRISEKAAYFLEESARTGVDGDLVALVVLGLRRSDGKILRFRDLLPNLHRHFDSGGQEETV